MKLEKNDIVKFDNDSQYVIVDIINKNNNKYFYFTSLNKNVEPEFVIMKESLNKEYTFEKLAADEFESIKEEFLNQMLD